MFGDLDSAEGGDVASPHQNEPEALTENSFTTTTSVRFAQVDPAGIVFYPRYFEMLNAAVEDWFAQRIGVSFATLHLTRRIGVPTVKLESVFKAPSELGDVLEIKLTPKRVGRSSCTLAFSIVGDGRVRIEGQITFVCMGLDDKVARDWPDDIRIRMP